MEHKTNAYQTGIETLEAEGYLGATTYYEAMKKVQQSNIKTLESELADLTEAMSEGMANGNIAKYSEDWYEMQQAINDVKESIADANLELIELNNNIRDLEWEYFDYAEDRISQITSEADFLIDLLSSSDLYADNGQLTDEGTATVGLHAVNYDTYMAQADDYAAAIKELDEAYADDSLNTDYIERREELLKLQQESILAAEDEKAAIVSLVEDGIELELDYLDELIQSYSDALDEASDLYEYSKKISSQTSEIASLQKQLAAYTGDTSEETKATVQKLRVELEDAQSDLEETQYDNYITETKKLLDTLYTDYEGFLNERLDDIDALISDMIDYTNTNAESISETLTTTADSVGYTLTESMTSIWNTSTTGITDVVTKYGESFSAQVTTLNETISSIKGTVEAMKTTAEAEAKTTVSSTTSSTASTKTSSSSSSSSGSSSSSSSSSSKSSSSSSSSSSSTQGNGKINVGDKVTYKSGKYYYDSYGTSPAGSKNLGKSVYITKYVSSPKSGQNYPVHISTGKKLGSGDLGWVKKSQISGYKTGGLVDYTGLAQLDGTPSKPEMVLNAQDTENFILLKDALASIAQGDITASDSYYSALGNITPIMSGITDLSDILQGTVGQPTSGTMIDSITVNIPIDHVLDYEDFITKMQNDSQFEKMIQAMSIDQVAGKSTLSKYKYKWG